MDITDIACSIVSKTLAPVHFVLQTAADAVAGLEGKILSTSDKYDYSTVVKRRKHETEKMQKGIIITSRIIILDVRKNFVNEDTKDCIADEIIKLGDQLVELQKDNLYNIKPISNDEK